MIPRPWSRSAIQALLFVATGMALAQAPGSKGADSPEANPARPTVTNPATLTPVGYLQFEQGYLGSLSSPGTASQYGINQVTKLTVQRRVLVQVFTQPFALSRVSGDPASTRDAGDVVLGAQVMLYKPGPSDPDQPKESEAAKSPVPTVSIGYNARVHSGTTPDTDQGGYSKSLLLLLSGDVGGFHYDTNYVFNQQNGSSADGSHDVRRAQFAQTLSINHNLFGPKLQVGAEVYHFSQPLVDVRDDGRPAGRANLFDLLFAASYQVKPNVVVDGGFSHGFTATSTGWQSFVGFTYLLPHRLWRGKA